MKAKKIFLSTILIIGMVLLAIGFFVGTGTDKVTAGGTILPKTDNIKDYNIETKTVTLKDKDSKEIASVELLTPLKHYVNDGEEVFVIEYNISSKMDLDKEFMGDTKTYDKGKLDKGDIVELNKEFIWKYVEYYEEEVPIYSYKSILSINGTMMTVATQIGTEYVTKENELLYDNDAMNMKKGESLIIRGYTDIHQGDNIEFIPEFSGLKVEEWANIVSTNGAETIDGDYTIVTFTSDGWFNITGDDLNASILVVAGGGAGGSSAQTPTFGGGGGAGGFIYENSFSITAGNYNVVIGAGGTPGTPGRFAGGKGANSSFSTLEALGGGGGGAYGPLDSANATDGGSGGGEGVAATAHEKVPGDGLAGQGFDGGSATDLSGSGGGGGGASEVGENSPNSNQAGDGGDGIQNAINGTLVYYAGGGGGSSNTDAGTGGLGGGANGRQGAGNGHDAVANTGGGGGGAGTPASTDFAGGAGGSGIVIIRYLTSATDIVNCTFSGFVKDEQDNALEGANVTVWNQFDVSEFYEDTTDVNGLWTINISNSTNTYMAGAYFNNTIIGQLKPYISGTC